MKSSCSFQHKTYFLFNHILVFSGEQVQDKNNLFEDSFDDVQEEVLTDKLTVLKLNTTIETEDPSEWV